MTQVCIIGAGPAGLMLSHLLHRQGIASVVLERRSRDYVERRVRAGVLEQGSTDLLVATGVGERMIREGLAHDGIKLRFAGEEHRIDFRRLTGRGITVYGQQEVIKDLIKQRLADGGEIWFDAEATGVEGIDGDPSPRCVPPQRRGGKPYLRVRGRLRRLAWRRPRGAASQILRAQLSVLLARHPG